MTALVVTLLASGTPALADFQAGVKAYEAENYKKAFDEWLPLARNNDPAAMRNIGHMYRRGLGVEQDYQKAMTWYKRAATLGFDRAQANVAGMYLAGEGVEQDYAQAANWFAQAAQQGHVISQYNLALLLENGLGVKKNERMALGWFAIAAQAGHPQSAKKAAALGQKLNITPEQAVNMQGEIVLLAKEKPDRQATETPPPAITEKLPGLAEPEKPAQVAAANAAAKAEEPKPVQKKSFYDAIRSLMGGQEKTTETGIPAAVGAVGAAKQMTEEQAAPPANEVVAAVPDSGAQAELPSDMETAAKPKTQSQPQIQAQAGAMASKSPVKDKPDVAAVPMGTVTAVNVPPPMPQPPIGAAPYGGGLSTAERLEMAALAYQLREYQTSLGIWAQLAEQNNAEAQYRLGSLFNAGQAVPRDRVRAWYWWDKARANGSSEAAAALAGLEESLTHQEKRQINRVN